MSTHFLITDREKIRKEWGKSESDVLRDIQIIKDWFATQKHLPETPSDNMMEFFLTNCKYSIEKTKQNLDMYYTARDLMPEFYRGIHPTKSKNMDIIYKTADYVALPQLTPSLYRVNIAKYKDVDPDEADIRKFLAHVMNNVYEVRVQEDLALGEVFVVDFTYLKFGVMNKLTPPFIKQYATIMEKVQTNRLKGIHILNPPTFIDVIISLFKSFLGKKLQNRIYLHHSLEELYKYVPVEILPSDYGGIEKSVQELVEIWKNKLAEYSERFDKLEEMHVDESQRPDKLENDELLGFHGNFKQINLD